MYLKRICSNTKWGKTSWNSKVLFFFAKFNGQNNGLVATRPFGFYFWSCKIFSSPCTFLGKISKISLYIMVQKFYCSSCTLWGKPPKISNPMWFFLVTYFLHRTFWGKIFKKCQAILFSKSFSSSRVFWEKSFKNIKLFMV